MKRNKLFSIFQAIIFAIIVSIAFQFARTPFGLICSILTFSLLPIAYTYQANKKLFLFAFGIALNLFNFTWLINTISIFGGFPKALSIIIYLLFAVFFSLQFLIIYLTEKLLSKFGTDNQSKFLIFSFGWMLSEYLFPKLFPWRIAHTTIYSKQISLLSSIISVELLGGILFFLFSNIFYLLMSKFNLKNHKIKFSDLLPILSLILLILLGQRKIYALQNLITASPEANIKIIQGNISLMEKHSRELVQKNINRHIELSNSSDSNTDIVIWPESAINALIPKSATKISLATLNAPLLTGIIAIDEEKKLYNSAILVDQLSNIIGSYDKIILMPFGEYLPFESTFPFLRKLSPMSGDFKRGTNITPIEYKNLKIGVLICYEDLVTDLAKIQKRNGANLLVNLTNDAWYGKTNAPYLHSLIASFRAIETSRYLVRATNTGHTAIINPYGDIEHELPIFEEKVLIGSVKLIED